MTRTEKLIGVVAVIALILGTIGFFNAGPQGPQGPRGNDGQTVGAIPGDSTQGERWCVGGVCRTSYRREFLNATGTPCSFPVVLDGRRKVLEIFTLDIRTPTSTAWTFRIGTSTTGNNAVTTILGQFTTGNINSLVYVASSSQFVNPSGSGIFGTTTQQFVNVDVNGAVLPVTPATPGTCTATFLELS